VIDDPDDQCLLMQALQHQEGGPLDGRQDPSS
jgi:hypothetical protein